MEMKIRTATPKDASSLLSIYAPYIEGTAVTFECEVPSTEEFRQRIETILSRHPYIVAEDQDTIVGYAYASAFKERAAYSRAVETSIYVKKGCHGQGIGKALYEELERRLKAIGILNMNACIAWTDTPNPYLTRQSPEFHHHMGYTRCAHFHQCGYKFGQWFDIIWMEKMIGEHT